MTQFTPVFARTAPIVSKFGSVTFVPVSATEAAAYVTFSNGVPRRIVGGAGGIEPHTHEISEINGLQSALDAASQDSESVHVFPAPTSGQVQFILPSAPTAPEKTKLIINNMIYGPESFSVSGPIITWGSSFVITTSDKISATYV